MDPDDEATSRVPGDAEALQKQLDAAKAASESSAKELEKSQAAAEASAKVIESLQAAQAEASKAAGGEAKALQKQLEEARDTTRNSGLDTGLVEPVVQRGCGQRG